MTIADETMHSTSRKGGTYHCDLRLLRALTGVVIRTFTRRGERIFLGVSSTTKMVDQKIGLNSSHRKCCLRTELYSQVSDFKKERKFTKVLGPPIPSLQLDLSDRWIEEFNLRV